MFGKAEIEFEAQIRLGAAIGHDHGYFRWPECKAPRSEGGGDEARNPDMKFTASLMGTFFSLKAPGYGIVGGDYGNGSIFVHKLDDLIVSDADRKRVLKHFRAKKKDEIDKVTADLAKLHGEMEALR